MDAQMLEALQNCSLFRRMDAAEIQRACAAAGALVRQFRRGETLWLRGDEVDKCGVVLRGRVRAETVQRRGAREVAAVHEAGGVFGDVLMATPAGRSPVDLLAAEDTAVLFLPFRALLYGDVGRLRENLLAEISEKFWALRRRLGYLSQRTLRGRVALYLLDTAAREGGGTFSLRCSREELADLLNVNRSALSRELSRMRGAGLLDFYRDSFRLLDRPGLERAID